jgi:hypothetical protein
MKQVLLVLLAFSLSLSLKAQPNCPIGFDVNAGKGGCPEVSECDLGNTYLVNGRIQLYFSSAISATDVISISELTTDNASYTYTFCESSRQQTNKGFMVEFCAYSTDPNQNLNLGTIGRIVSLNISINGNVTECEDISKLTGQPAALPVSMKSFTATRSKQTVGIKFETLSESNNKGFYVQRNTNGTWENIAFIFSKADNGNSGTPISYEYNDLNPIKGVSQYRLQQVDLDLRFRYSEIRMVRGEEQPAKHLLFPNPSSDGKVNIVFDVKSATRNILVSDMSGRIVKSFRNITAANLSIDNLENGVYSIQIIDVSTSETVVEKIIIKRR